MIHTIACFDKIQLDVKFWSLSIISSWMRFTVHYGHSKHQIGLHFLSIKFSSPKDKHDKVWHKVMGLCLMGLCLVKYPHRRKGVGWKSVGRVEWWRMSLKFEEKNSSIKPSYNMKQLYIINGLIASDYKIVSLNNFFLLR